MASHDLLRHSCLYAEPDNRSNRTGAFVRISLSTGGSDRISEVASGAMRHQARCADRSFERELRQHATRAERVLWSALRALPTFKFRRQHRLGVYLVDFYCARVRLAVELDGSVHDDDQARAYDRARTAELAALGVRMLRFQNEEVLANVGVVRNRIEEACSILL